ncbi:MAG: RIP metalloprotease RseP, partial [Verrucomicrobiota bacterium]
MNYIFDFFHWLLICVEVVLLFNLMIVVHEIGHYLAARWRGLVVEKFGIWFGNPIWKKTINGVEYSLGSIPAGGFVALPQMAPMEAMEGDSKLDRSKLPPISTTDKIIVAFAGPLFSISLAFFFAFIVWGVGRPVSEGEGSTKIGYVVPDSPAQRAGLLAGDQILSIEGHPVHSFSKGSESITWRIVSSESELIPIVVERGGQTVTVQVKPEIEQGRLWERKGLRQIKIAPIETARVGKVMKNSPADLAGIQAGDIFTKLNGEALYSSVPIFQTIKDHPESPLALTVSRQGSELEKTILPVKPIGMDRAMLGVEWDPVTTIDHQTPWFQVRASLDTMVNMFGALLSRKSDIGLQHMSGPVGIMRLYYLLFQSEHGWKYALWFSVVLNVNLGVMNMLPMPVLDGGHITIALL